MKMLPILSTTLVGVSANRKAITWLVFIKAPAITFTALKKFKCCKMKKGSIIHFYLLLNLNPICLNKRLWSMATNVKLESNFKTGWKILRTRLPVHLKTFSTAIVNGGWSDWGEIWSMQCYLWSWNEKTLAYLHQSPSVWWWAQIVQDPAQIQKLVIMARALVSDYKVI